MTWPSGIRGLAVRIGGVAVVYYLGALVGLRLALVGGQVTPLWPPTGVALAALLVFGVRVWPGIMLGALAVNIPLGPTPLAVGMISVGNTLAPLCAYLLLTLVDFRSDLARLKDSVALVFLGAFTGMLVSSTIGAAALVLGGDVPGSHFLATWSVWWTGDAMGVLLIAPLLLIARNARLPKRISPVRAAEAVALIGGTFAVTTLGTNTVVHLLFLPFPFLIWGGLRFRQAGALLAALTASIVAILSVARGSDAFAVLNLTDTMIGLQAFNMCVALTALIHATIATQRDMARREIEVACAQLTESLTMLADPLSHGRILEIAQRFPRDSVATTKRENYLTGGEGADQ
ncbi:MASE1 domain-containing protein [Amycolatopsis pigmentata]|uniref:MASE1 domain-containing protein n=1 Tax=Amycolatopsis pigmentata TaxID=450801 RepID=A0ABW5G1N6_9PSEU